MDVSLDGIDRMVMEQVVIVRVMYDFVFSNYANNFIFCAPFLPSLTPRNHCSERLSFYILMKTFVALFRMRK